MGMAGKNYNANILIEESLETNAYYQVSLTFLPNVGDFIDLNSLIDQGSGHASRHYLKVDRITHVLEDIAGRGADQRGGHHFVTIHASRVDVPELLE